MVDGNLVHVETQLANLTDKVDRLTEIVGVEDKEKLVIPDKINACWDAIFRIAQSMGLAKDDARSKVLRELETKDPTLEQLQEAYVKYTETKHPNPMINIRKALEGLNKKVDRLGERLFAEKEGVIGIAKEVPEKKEDGHK